MFRNTTLALLALTAAFVVSAGPLTSAGAAPVPKHLMKEPEGDKAKFQGKWKVQSITMGGKDALGNLDMVIEFQGDQFRATINFAGTAQTTTATVKYGANGTRQLSTTETRAVANGQQTDTGAKDETVGYAFDGEKLLLGSAGGGGKAVDPLKPGPGDLVIVLVRAK